MQRRKIVPYLFLGPYYLIFVVFIVIPVLVALGLSMTDFNAVQAPHFVGLSNYLNLFLQDEVFIKHVLPNTLIFALIVGPVGYLLSFFMAWSLSQLTKGPRTVLALILYSPSMTAGTAMAVIWRVLFSGDRMGYINNLLINMGIITQPIIFLQSSQYLLPAMILVGLWSSMGVGFLAMLAGLLNVDRSLYEAAMIDGMRNRWQEIFYITIPSMKPQMLFGAVMAIVSAFQQGGIGVQLSGTNPTPGYAGQLMVNHAEDFGFIRYEMGYASAVSVVLLVMIYAFSKIAQRVFREKGEG